MINHPLLEQRADAATPGCATVWNIDGFREIQSIVGRDRAATLLRSYALHLELASASIHDTGFDSLRLREIVHNLQSMSGQLGFEALHDFCHGVAMAPCAVDLDDIVEPLLVLIAASRAAAYAHGAPSQIADTIQMA
jgi:hypothetical protein